MASRQHNAQFHKSKTLDNKYVRICDPDASDPGRIRVSFCKFGVGLLSLTVLPCVPVCRCLEMR